jgi:hypothetical protein
MDKIKKKERRLPKENCRLVENPINSAPLSQRHVRDGIALVAVTGAGTAAHGAGLYVIARSRRQVFQHDAPGLRENPGSLPIVRPLTHEHLICPHVGDR